LVSFEIQPRQVRELSNLRRERGQLVFSEPQISQLRELPNHGWKRGELVAMEGQAGQVRELSDLGRQRGELVVPEPQMRQVPCEEFAFGGRALKAPLDRSGGGRKGVVSGGHRADFP
jgi:hypothetical protein